MKNCMYRPGNCQWRPPIHIHVYVLCMYTYAQTIEDLTHIQTYMHACIRKCICVYYVAHRPGNCRWRSNTLTNIHTYVRTVYYVCMHMLTQTWKLPLKMSVLVILWVSSRTNSLCFSLLIFTLASSSCLFITLTVCMYVCMHICMYVCCLSLLIFTLASSSRLLITLSFRMYVCRYVCRYVWMYYHMYVCCSTLTLCVCMPACILVRMLLVFALVYNFDRLCVCVYVSVQICIAVYKLLLDDSQNNF